MCRMAVIRDKMHLWVFYHFHWPFTILSFSRSEICSDFKLKFSSSSKNAVGSIDWFDDLVQFLKQELKNHFFYFSGFVAVVDWSGWVEISRSAILVQWSARCPHGRWLWVHFIPIYRKFLKREPAPGVPHPEQSFFYWVKLTLAVIPRV